MNSAVVTGNIEVFILITWTVRACLHQASESMLQLCDDANDTVLIENNWVTPDWDFNPFSSYIIICNENSIISVITELSQRWLWRSV